jgi:hypothetical protein
MLKIAKLKKARKVAQEFSSQSSALEKGASQPTLCVHIDAKGN